MILQLIYVSRAAPGITERDAYDVIRTAHNRNSRHGLTGALILLDGHFLQVLEGERIALDLRFQAILADARHVDVQVRRRHEVEAPSFPGEWMALRHGEAIDAALRARYGYQPGFPAAAMDPDRLLDFARACCAVGLAQA